MRVRQRAVQAIGVAAAAAGVVAAASAPAGASTSAGQAVHVVKDQAGGAFYNVVTGERFDVTAASAVSTLGVFGIQAADGAVLTESGALLAPINTAVGGTVADSVVAVAETTGVGTYQSANDGAVFTVQSVGAALPAGNEFALKTATGAILTLNSDVLLPIQSATGLRS